MTKLAIIGGTGLASMDELNVTDRHDVLTPYGETSSSLLVGDFADKKIVFLARHGSSHSIPPHKINYRANVWALKSIGVTDIVSVAAVGGIHPEIPPEKIVIPDQIIDYTYGRQHTFFEDDLSEVTHIDFTNPYNESLRQKLIKSSTNLNLDVHEGGVYGVTQGPRLESAAEVVRLERDGCDIVGMTGMPEAALAKELDLNYACCALCVNWAAGKINQEITMDEILSSLTQGMKSIKSILVSLVSVYYDY